MKMKQILLCKFLLSLLMVGALFAPVPAFADGSPQGDVIFNINPYVPPLPLASISEIEWNKVNHIVPSCDMAYSPTISANRNDVANTLLILKCS